MRPYAASELPSRGANRCVTPSSKPVAWILLKTALPLLAVAATAADLDKLAIQIENSRPILSWSNTVGEAYVLEVTAELSASAWNHNVALTTDAPDVAWADADPSRATQFYRVVLAAEPAPFLALQQALERACANQGIVGATAAVMFTNRALWVGTAGHSHATVRVRPHTPFEIGSVTKTFVAATILRLAEEGRLALDDAISAWLPALAHSNIATNITIRQLLTHRSGLYNFGDDPDFRLALFEDWARYWQPEDACSSSKPRTLPQAPVVNTAIPATCCSV
jgi:CubicO group peptidase (beta-lactamase class C family)